MTGAAQMLTVRVPLAMRKQRGGRKLVLTPGGMAARGAAAADTTLVKALARAFRWRKMLETGRYGTIGEIAAAEKINDSYVSRLLRLTLLAPDIVEAILDGRQPEGMKLPGLMEPFLVEWQIQRKTMWLEPASRASNVRSIVENAGRALPARPSAGPARGAGWKACPAARPKHLPAARPSIRSSAGSGNDFAAPCLEHPGGSLACGAARFVDGYLNLSAGSIFIAFGGVNVL